ncbi:MAG: hypothetical protein ABI700_10065 [Chloroflexota bacterium]
MSYLKEIVEEQRFSKDIDSFRGKYTHIDELQEWISNTLPGNPRIGRPFKEDPELYVLTTPVLQDTPSFWVVYFFDENKIYLRSIEPVRDE